VRQFLPPYVAVTRPPEYMKFLSSEYSAYLSYNLPGALVHREPD
jgi:hypothetical protein